MNIFIGADHGGFELKNKLMEYLQEKNIRIEDLGNYSFDPLDDYPDYAQKVAQAVLQNPKEFLGIVICKSGVGVCISANRYKGVRAALGFSPEQVTHARENDHINVLGLAAEYMSLEKIIPLVETFITSQPKENEKYQRRIRKLDE